MKKRTNIKAYVCGTLLVILSLFYDHTAHAQLKGDHILGDYGLNAGTQLPPNISMAFVGNFYRATKLKNSFGEELKPFPDINVFLGGIGFSTVTNLRILCANYGASVLIAGMSNRLDGNIIQDNNDFAFTDMFVQPVQLGWHRKRADFLAGFSMYIPTGKYEFGGAHNTGLGMWGYEFSAGTTVHLDSAKKWNFSTIAFYELHSVKRNSSAKAGDIATLEGGIGRTFYHKIPKTPVPMIFNLGVIYYMQFKMTNDKIPIGNLVFTGNKDRIYALGAEGNLMYPRTGTAFSFRWLGELGAKNRFEGYTIFVTLGQGLKSLAKKEQTNE